MNNDIESIENNKLSTHEYHLRVEKIEREIAKLLNQYGLDNQFDTPDFILAQMMVSTLELNGQTIKTRDGWFNNKKSRSE